MVALCFVLLVPIKVPQKSLLCKRVVTSNQGLENCLGSTLVEYSNPDEQQDDALSVLKVSLYIQSSDLEQKLEESEASKQNSLAELQSTREELAAKVASLSRDLAVQKQLLKIKAEECDDMEETITAQSESNQSLKREREGAKV